MKKIILIVGGIILVSLLGRFGWAYYQAGSLDTINAESTPVAIFKGYFDPKVTGTFGAENSRPTDCGAFIVYKNNDPLFKFLANYAPLLIHDNGSIPLTILSPKMPADIVAKILASNKEHPVLLTVQKRVFNTKYPPPQLPCESLVDVISVDTP